MSKNYVEHNCAPPQKKKKIKNKNNIDGFNYKTIEKWQKKNNNFIVGIDV